MKILWCYTLIWMFADMAIGQITYTAAFTKTLEKVGISYLEPLEQWLHVTIPPTHDYMQYDLVLQNDRNDFEVRYHVHPHRRTGRSIPASIAVSRLIANVASNDEANEIRVNIPPDEFLRQAYNADHGIIAYFIPKMGFSEKPYGALLSLYTEDLRGIDIVLLYTDPEFDPVAAYRSIYFDELKERK